MTHVQKLVERIVMLEEALRQGRELAFSNQRNATMRHALFEWGEYADRVLNGSVGDAPQETGPA
jgi:hypothetical protein